MARDGVIIKTGANIAFCHPKILKAVWVFRDVLEDIAGKRCVVTSAWSGEHSNGSFHHYGMAVDIRSKEIPNLSTKIEIRDVVRSILGNEYDVLLEDIGGSNEHYHVEWDAGRSVREEWVDHIFLGGPPPIWS